MHRPRQHLRLQLAVSDNEVVCDFAGFAGRPLAANERTALHDALDDAIATLNLRLRRVYVDPSE